jgi:hypothetical protein
MSTDYKVRLRSYARVSEIALQVRRRLSVAHYYSFNIARLITTLAGETFGKLGKLKLDIFDEPSEHLAYVTFSPLTLHVDREIWDLADLGDPKSRFILAHELGHLLMHEHHEQAYSEDGSGRLTFIQPEESAEVQANWFAACFLAPDHLAWECRDETELCLQFDFPKEYASLRLDEMSRNAPKRSGATCACCGNIMIVRSDGRLTCETCDLLSSR